MTTNNTETRPSVKSLQYGSNSQPRASQFPSPIRRPNSPSDSSSSSSSSNSDDDNINKLSSSSSSSSSSNSDDEHDSKAYRILRFFVPCGRNKKKDLRFWCVVLLDLSIFAVVVFVSTWCCCWPAKLPVSTVPRTIPITSPETEVVNPETEVSFDLCAWIEEGSNYGTPISGLVVERFNSNGGYVTVKSNSPKTYRLECKNRPMKILTSTLFLADGFWDQFEKQEYASSFSMQADFLKNIQVARLGIYGKVRWKGLKNKDGSTQKMHLNKKLQVALYNESLSSGVELVGDGTNSVLLQKHGKIVRGLYSGHTLFKLAEDVKISASDAK